MGSFNSICCVSGLPLTGNDEVRWLLLTQNPYWKGGFVCEDHGRWIPRTWPIKARYNDYGTIERWEPGPLVDAVMAGFRVDLVEMGVGDNQVHDVATARDMTFEELLDAVWEGRIYVESDMRAAAKGHPGAPPWLPTLQTVTSALASLGSACIVDEQMPGVRVRGEGYDETKRSETLVQAKALLEAAGFAVVLTAGSGFYAHPSELHCFAAPAPAGERRSMRQTKERAPLRVQQAMIREDVWQALLLEKRAQFNGPKLTAAAYVEQTQAYMRKTAESNVARDKLGALEDFLNGSGRRFALPGGGALVDSVSSTIDLAWHSKFLVGAMSSETADAVDGIARSMGEFLFIRIALGAIGYVFRPSDTAGPQDADWAVHARMHGVFAKIARQVGASK